LLDELPTKSKATNIAGDKTVKQRLKAFKKKVTGGVNGYEPNDCGVFYQGEIPFLSNDDGG